MLKIGYHYTTWKNWQKIQKQGLRAKKVDQNSIKELLGLPDLKGVWLWPNLLKGKDHLVQLLVRLGQRNDADLVLLKVLYTTQDEVIGMHGERVLVTGGSNIKKFKGNDQKMVLICCDIYPKYINLVKRYDLLKLLK